MGQHEGFFSSMKIVFVFLSLILCSHVAQAQIRVISGPSEVIRTLPDVENVITFEGFGIGVGDRAKFIDPNEGSSCSTQSAAGGSSLEVVDDLGSVSVTFTEIGTFTLCYSFVDEGFFKDWGSVVQIASSGVSGPAGEITAAVQSTVVFTLEGTGIFQGDEMKWVSDQTTAAGCAAASPIGGSATVFLLEDNQVNVEFTDKGTYSRFCYKFETNWVLATFLDIIIVDPIITDVAPQSLAAEISVEFSLIGLYLVDDVVVKWVLLEVDCAEVSTLDAAVVNPAADGLSGTFTTTTPGPGEYKLCASRSYETTMTNTDPDEVGFLTVSEPVISWLLDTDAPAQSSHTFDVTGQFLVDTLEIVLIPSENECEEWTLGGKLINLDEDSFESGTVTITTGSAGTYKPCYRNGNLSPYIWMQNSLIITLIDPVVSSLSPRNGPAEIDIGVEFEISGTALTSSTHNPIKVAFSKIGGTESAEEVCSSLSASGVSIIIDEVECPQAPCSKATIVISTGSVASYFPCYTRATFADWVPFSDKLPVTIEQPVVNSLTTTSLTAFSSNVVKVSGVSLSVNVQVTLISMSLSCAEADAFENGAYTLYDVASNFRTASVDIDTQDSGTHRLCYRTGTGKDFTNFAITSTILVTEPTITSFTPLTVPSGMDSIIFSIEGENMVSDTRLIVSSSSCSLLVPGLASGARVDLDSTDFGTVTLDTPETAGTGFACMRRENVGEGAWSNLGDEATTVVISHREITEAFPTIVAANFAMTFSFSGTMITDQMYVTLQTQLGSCLQRPKSGNSVSQIAVTNVDQTIQTDGGPVKIGSIGTAALTPAATGIWKLCYRWDSTDPDWRTAGDVLIEAKSGSQLLSGEFNVKLTQAAFTFDSAIHSQHKGSVLCTEYFDATEFAASMCEAVDNTITATLDPENTLATGQTVTLKDNAVRTAASVGLPVYFVGSVALEIPLEATPPEIEVIGSTSIPICLGNDETFPLHIVLDASSTSDPTADIRPIIFRWLMDEDASTLTQSEVARLLLKERDSFVDFETTHDLVTDPITVDESFIVVRVEAENAFGLKSFSSFDVGFTNSTLSFEAVSALTQLINAGEDAVVEAKSEAPCGDFDFSSLQYSWTQDSGFPVDLELSTVTTPKLELDSSVLRGGEVYSFSLQRCYQLICETLSFTVEVNSLPLSPFITGGTTRWVSNTKAFVLDASLSFDPNNSPTNPSYEWNCSPPDIEGSSATFYVDDVLSERLEPEQHTSVITAVIELQGEHECTVTMSQGAISQSATVTLLVQPPGTLSNMPIVTITSDPIDLHQVSPLSEIALKATDEAGVVSQTFDWKLTDSEGVEIPISTLRFGTDASVLYIPENTLTEGETYTVSVTSFPSGEGYAEIEFIAGTIISGGVLTISPEVNGVVTGQELVTEFELVASSFSSQSTLEYSFGFFDDDVFVPLRRYSTSSRYITTLPASTTGSTTVVCRARDQVGTIKELTKLVLLTPLALDSAEKIEDEELNLDLAVDLKNEDLLFKTAHNLVNTQARAGGDATAIMETLVTALTEFDVDTESNREIYLRLLPRIFALDSTDELVSRKALNLLTQASSSSESLTKSESEDLGRSISALLVNTKRVDDDNSRGSRAGDSVGVFKQVYIARLHGGAEGERETVEIDGISGVAAKLSPGDEAVVSMETSVGSPTLQVSNIPTVTIASVTELEESPFKYSGERRRLDGRRRAQTNSFEPAGAVYAVYFTDDQGFTVDVNSTGNGGYNLAFDSGYLSGIGCIGWDDENYQWTDTLATKVSLTSGRIVCSSSSSFISVRELTSLLNLSEDDEPYGWLGWLDGIGIDRAWVIFLFLAFCVGAIIICGSIWYCHRKRLKVERGKKRGKFEIVNKSNEKKYLPGNCSTIVFRDMLLKDDVDHGDDLIEVDDVGLTVGKDPRVDHCIEKDPAISSRHFKVEFYDNAFWLEDMDSRNGTTVNGTELEPEDPWELRVGDVVVFGNQKWRVEDFTLNVEADANDDLMRTVGELILGLDKGEQLRVSEKGATFGRSRDNDVYMRVSAVSKYHAKIIYKKARFYLVDLGSNNGTLLNGRKIVKDEPELLEEGDEIEMGVKHFVVDSVKTTDISAGITAWRTVQQTLLSDGRNSPSGYSPLSSMVSPNRSAVLSPSSAKLLSPKTDDNGPTPYLTPGGGGATPGMLNVTKMALQARDLENDRVHKVDESGMTIGRSRKNKLCIPHHSLSAYHCRIFFSKGDFVVSDLGSTNGTFLNGRPVTADEGPQDLDEGDELSVGQYTFLVKDHNVGRFGLADSHYMFLEIIKFPEDNSPKTRMLKS